jgi:hypothetical protein
MCVNPDQKPTVPQRRKRDAAVAVFGMAWALPLSILGLLLAIPVLTLRGRIYLISGMPSAILVRGPLSDYLLERHPLGAMSAMAIGHVIIASQRGLSRQIITHEMEHVRQAARWGLLFPFAYTAASLWALLHGRDIYWNNVFEVAAREAEKFA